MIALVTRVAGVLAASCLLLPAPLSAQQAPSEDAARSRKSGTYLKAGLGYWQGNISSRARFTQWNVDLFGAEYHLTSVNAEIETYFGGTFLVSGFSVGYRKDDVRNVESGHMVRGMLFRDMDLTLLAVKIGGGIEWGVPSLTFDQTEFDFLDDGGVRYRHIYPARNATVPFGTRTSGALYPFAELSAVQRPWIFLVEVGMRLSVIGFHFDDYDVNAADEIRHAFARRRVIVPHVFANVGIRLF